MLDGREIEGARVESRIVPNSFFTCIDAVTEAIAELQPEAILMYGILHHLAVTELTAIPAPVFAGIVEEPEQLDLTPVAKPFGNRK